MAHFCGAELLLHGAWRSLLSNLGGQGHEWPPSKTGCLPAGRDRGDDGCQGHRTREQVFTGTP